MTDEPSNISETEARQTAIEIVAHLVNVKSLCVTKLLRPAGVPEPLLVRFMKEVNPATDKKLTKREGISMIIDALEQERDGGSRAVVRAIIDVARQWKSFEDAASQHDARAAVERAKDIAGPLAASDRRQQEEFERLRRQSESRRKAERLAELRRGSELLRLEFEDLYRTEPHARGYALQEILQRLFGLHRFAVHRSFQRNDGGEQIDAAFELDSWHYLVECRWRQAATDARDIDGLSGQVGRSGKPAMGLFLSIEHWSENVVPLLKMNSSKNVVLMSGADLHGVLRDAEDLREFIRAKVAALSLKAEPFLSYSDWLQRRG